VVVTGISLGAGMSPATPVATSSGPTASPDVFHCC
jgi:hypothetical protein